MTRTPQSIRKIDGGHRCNLAIASLLIVSVSLSLPVHGKPAVNPRVTDVQQGDWAESIQQLKQQLPPSNTKTFNAVERKALKDIAQAYWSVGQTDAAIQSLERLGEQYQQSGDLIQWGRVLTQQAQYLIEIGNLNQARKLLCNDTFTTLQACRSQSAIQLATRTDDTPGQIAALGSLGILLSKNSELELSEGVLKTALAQSQQTVNRIYQPQLRNSLGQTYLRRAVRDQTYARLSQNANDPGRVSLFQGRSQASLNQAIALLEANQRDLAVMRPSQEHLDTATDLIQAYQYQSADNNRPQIEALFRQAQVWLEQQPLSQRKLYTASRLVQLKTQPSSFGGEAPKAGQSWLCEGQNSFQSLAQEIDPIINMARTLQNPTVEAYSLGLLGHAAQCQKQFAVAQNYTEQAISLSQNSHQQYQWEWQLGQIFQAQGNSPAAIKAYEQAVTTLEEVRGDVAVSNRDVQLDLQANIEGLYRELAYLQLQQLSNSPNPRSDVLTQTALKNLDRLRLVELQNYLATDCEFPEIQATLSAQMEQTAIIRTVMFADRMAIAFTYPDQQNQARSELHWVQIPQTEIKTTINQFRFDLEKRSDLTQKYLTGATQLYDWIIRPFESQLKNANIDTLVFIHDGLLRSIPMASLHDGQSFLVESYAIGNTTYWSPSPEKTLPQNQQMLAFGLTEAAEISQYSQPLSFAALPGVREELLGIQTTLKNSQIRINQDFSPRLLTESLTQTSPNILHLATHARFGVDPRETFLITGEKVTVGANSTNATLNMLALYQLLRSLQQPINLLALTGCETAVGNERDALGITGAALQAGVDTVMASLWQIDDQATGMIVPAFYQNLGQGQSKAKALQQAQINWLKVQKEGRQRHPGYWAPLILVGNWQ